MGTRTSYFLKSSCSNLSFFGWVKWYLQVGVEAYFGAVWLGFNDHAVSGQCNRSFFRAMNAAASIILQIKIFFFNVVPSPISSVFALNIDL